MIKDKLNQLVVKEQRSTDEMKIIPMTLKKANAFVDRYHRHNKHCRGCKFCLGLMHDNELVGVAVCGRPVARNLDDGFTLEILRVCIKDTAPKGANSKLYARCRKIGQSMGYKKIITYTLKSESQCSLRAVSAHIDAEVKPGDWNRPNRKRASQPVYNEEKIRWIID